MTTTETSIRIAGRNLGKVRHICAFFHNKEEEHRVLQDFIKDGINQGEKGLHIVDARTRSDHRERLRNGGIAVDECEQSGQLKIACWEDAYLKNDYFDQDRQLKFLEDSLKKNHADGCSMTRLVANMEWALEEKAGVENIVEYESRLNYVLPNYPDPVICTYDLSRFDAGTAMDILRVHPVIIIGGILQENPLYVPPDVFLQELHARQ